MGKVIPFPSRPRTPAQAADAARPLAEGIATFATLLQQAGVTPTVGLAALVAGVWWFAKQRPRRRRHICRMIVAVEREARRHPFRKGPS